MNVSAILYTIILLGALQGFITGGILFFSKYNRRSGRLLAMLIWLMSLASLNLYLNHIDWYYTHTAIKIIHSLIPMELVMVMGPLIFFYIRSLQDPDFSITGKRRYHFLPIVVDLVPQITALIYYAGVLLDFIKPNPEPWGFFIDDYYVYVDIPRWISITAYLVLSASWLSSFEANRKPEEERLEKAKWLQQFLRVFMIFQAIWLVYLVIYIIPSTRDRLLQTVSWYPVYIPLSIMIYWMGIKGVIISRSFKRSMKRAPSVYEQFSLDMIEQIAHQLTLAMERDKLYLNPLLNLGLLARHIGSPPKRVSAVLNQHFKKNFNEYVNEYRIQEFKMRIRQEGQRLTIAGVAGECGFNSQATFQRTFKQLTGITPAEYWSNPDLTTRI